MSVQLVLCRIYIKSVHTSGDYQVEGTCVAVLDKTDRHIQESCGQVHAESSHSYA